MAVNIWRCYIHDVVERKDLITLSFIILHCLLTIQYVDDEKVILGIYR